MTDERLTARQVRDLVGCPFCGALAGSRCLRWHGSTFEYQAENHRSRVKAARAGRAAELRRED